MLLLQLFTHLSWLTLPALARPQSLITDDSVAVSARELQVLDSRTVSKPLRRREKIPTLLLPPDLNLTNAFNQTLSPPYAILNGKRILGVPDPKHGDYVKYLPLSYPDEPITFDKHFPIPLPIPFIGDAVDLEVSQNIPLPLPKVPR